MPQRKQRNTGLKTGHYTVAGKDAGATRVEGAELGCVTGRRAGKDSVVGAAIGRLFLGGGSRGWSGRAERGIVVSAGRGGRSSSRILRAACRVIQSGGMLENAACVLSDAFHAGGVGRIGSLDATIVSAGGLVDIAAEMIEKTAEQQAGVSSEHRIIHGIQVQLARRP